MSDAPWWKRGSVYQIYPRSFQDSDGDGVGDLPGLLDRLDYVTTLGVDAIWLSPVHPSPQADFGYDISDYRGVDPTYGTLADMDRLIAAAHDRGMKVLLDGVFNHTSDQHPWFVESRSSRRADRRDWYLWRDQPNNWKSTFGGPAWTRDEATGQVYLHSFLPSQPDLNWRNPAVADAVLDVLRFWFDRGVDGFRLDVFNCYRKHPELLDNPRRWHPAGLVYGYLGQHHVYDRDQPDLPEVLGRMREVADRYAAVLVGETLDERFRYDRAADFVGDDQLHMAFHFALLHSRWTASHLRAAIRAQLDELPADGWPTWVIANHDFRRAATRWGTARVKAAAVIQLTLPGTPFIYQGDELGVPEGRLSRREIQDPPGKRFWPFFKGRDGARIPMPWDGSRHRGFTTGTPWLPAYPPTVPDAARQDEDPASVLATYRTLLRLRRDVPALRDGGIVWRQPHDRHVLAWTRPGPEPVRVVVNTTSRRRSVDLVDAIATRTLYATTGRDHGGRAVVLDPDEAVVLAVTETRAGIKPAGTAPGRT